MCYYDQPVHVDCITKKQTSPVSKFRLKLWPCLIVSHKAKVNVNNGWSNITCTTNIIHWYDSHVGRKGKHTPLTMNTCIYSWIVTQGYLCVSNRLLASFRFWSLSQRAIRWKQTCKLYQSTTALPYNILAEVLPIVQHYLCNIKQRCAALSSKPLLLSPIHWPL